MACENKQNSFDGMPDMLGEVLHIITGMAGKFTALQSAIQQTGEGSDETTILSTKQVAELLGVKESTVDTLRSRKRIKYYKPDGVVYYIKSDILDYIRSGAVATDSEIREGVTFEIPQRRKRA